MFLEWKSDLKASFVVFLVALPLCLGIALASNAPLSSGLLAGIVGGLVIGSLSGSQVGVSGPAAGLTVIVANGIAKLGSFEIFATAVFLAGLVQIFFGLFRGGKIGDYFPTAVIRGMLAAIGVILILKQLPNTLGLSKTTAFHSGILLISFASLTIMILWDKMAAKGLRLFKLVPGALIAVLCSIGLNMLFKSYFPELALGKEFLVQLPFQGGFSEFVSVIKMPDLRRVLDFAVIKIALTLAIVASLETLLCVDAADKSDPEKRVTSKDRELLAQGVGNAISGLVGGLPISAVIVRTSANMAAGNKTKLSSILHGFWLLICVALIPNVLNLIPLASLACLLLLVGYKLCKPTYFFEMKKRGWDQLFIFTATIIAIVATDLLVGFFIGVIVAVFLEYKNLSLRPFTITQTGGRTVIQFSQNVGFFHKPEIQKIISAVPEGQQLHIQGMNQVFVHIDVKEVILNNDRVAIDGGVVR